MKPVVPAGTGVVRGMVTFAGKAPAPKVLEGTKCHAGAKPVMENALLVGDGGRVRNVVVFVKDGPNVARPANAPVLLDQVDCRYEPRVVAVRTGQALRVRSSDPTIHNVHGQPEANPPFNFGMTGAGETKDLTFARPEASPFRVKCDVHPWMAGYVGVFDHPFFAVTGEDGAFELAGLPAGSYTVVAWHERLGSREQQVTVADGQPAVRADVTFGKP